MLDRAGRAGTRTTFTTADDNHVGLGLGHTGSDGSHTALGYEFHADAGSRVDVFEVEDELCQVFDGVNIVMRRRRDKRDAGY